MVPVYLDVPITGAICGLILDAALLWMVGQITAFKPGLPRLMLGGMLGGGYHFLLLLNQASDGLLYSWATSPWLFILLPLPMVGLTFYPVNNSKFMGILGNFYLLAFLLTGINWGIDSLNQRFFGFEFSFGWRFLIHLTLVFILGEIGWGVVHRKIWEQTCLYPVRIEWEGNCLATTALLDTGNRLQDPLTKAPVVILELEVIRPYLPEKVVAMLLKLQQGEMDLHFEVADYWQERLRILPFNTIGQDHGILVGFRPDRVVVGQKEREICSTNTVVGLYNRKLSGEGTFHALFPPELISE